MHTRDRPAAHRYPHWTCGTHGDFDARVEVGCPECVRVARAKILSQQARIAQLEMVIKGKTFVTGGDEPPSDAASDLIRGHSHEATTPPMPRSKTQAKRFAAQMRGEEQPPTVTQWHDIATAPNHKEILILRDDDSIELIPADDNTYQWQPYKRHACVNTPKLWCRVQRPGAAAETSEPRLMLDFSSARSLLAEYAKSHAFTAVDGLALGRFADWMDTPPSRKAAETPAPLACKCAARNQAAAARDLPDNFYCDVCRPPVSEKAGQ